MDDDDFHVPSGNSGRIIFEIILLLLGFPLVGFGLWIGIDVFVGPSDEVRTDIAGFMLIMAGSSGAIGTSLVVAGYLLCRKRRTTIYSTGEEPHRDDD